MACTVCSSTEQWSDGKCAPCGRARQKAYDDRNREKVRERNRRYAADPESKRKRKDRELQQNYGISIDDYEVMYDLQDGCCYICNRPASESGKGLLVVDHCHATGDVRKLLCSNCNVALGMAQDDVETLAKMISYIIEHKTDI